MQGKISKRKPWLSFGLKRDAGRKLLYLFFYIKSQKEKMKKLTKNQVIKICEKLDVDFMSFDYLGKGGHNVSFVINTSQGRFVLRIENNLQFDNLWNEYKFLKRTKGKLGPKVFLFDDSKKILDRKYFVEEFIEGEHPKKADNKYIKLMAEWYKELHKIKVKRKMLSLYKKKALRNIRNLTNCLISR